MLKTQAKRLPRVLTRRELGVGALKMLIVAGLQPHLWGERRPLTKPVRTVNVMNFIRAEDPRQKVDLIEPVREQMALIKAHTLPATWLLQYDALVEGPFVAFLKSQMPSTHEAGIWFEMNRKICDDAGVAWRGNPEWEWDYHVPVAYAIGYTPDERRRLADTAMATFKKIFGHEAKSVASWNLDAITLAHLSDHYGVDAFGNCRDQLATDGFTIWGAPIAGYYPSRQNAWSPAVEERNQIATPMFRLLGQDPVYYYDNQLSYPDTMEPAWPSGQSKMFVDRFLAMIAHAPTQAFSYAQLGQENSFGWPVMSAAYAMQMDLLSRMRSADGIVVETMGATGRRFKRAYKTTPTQAQVMLEDPFGHTNPAERTLWYQSRFLRANLHFRGAEFYLRDLHVYSDRFPQPFLTETVRVHGIDQRMLAVLDGYHWSDGKLGHGYTGAKAGGHFVLLSPEGSETPLSMNGLPDVEESIPNLRANVPLEGGGSLSVLFKEREVEFALGNAPSHSKLLLRFTWNVERSALQHVSAGRLDYRFQDFKYAVSIEDGIATKTARGVDIASTTHAGFRLRMAQPST